MNRKTLFWILILAFFVILFVRYYGRGPSRHYSDFRVYHTTAGRFLRGEDIYDTSDPGVTPFKYSPFFALLTSPLGFLPIHEASLVFFTVNFLLFLLIIIFSGKMTGAEKIGGRKKIILYALPLVAVFRFVLLVLDSGQASFFMIASALAALYLAEKNKDLSAGALLAFSVMIKYVTFIFLPYWILRKKWKAVFSTLAFLVIYAYLPALFCGVGRATRYLLEWLPFITKTSLDQGSWTDYKNQSVYSFVLRLLMKNSPYENTAPSWSILDFHAALFVGIAAAAILYAWALFSGTRRGARPTLTYAVLFAGVTLFNPNCWPFNFVALCLPVMVLTHHLLENNFRDKVTLLMGGAALILLNIGSQSFSREGMQYLSEVYSFLTIGGLLIFFAALRLKRG